MNAKYEIIFYEDSKGKSEIFDFVEKLRIQSTKNKNAKREIKDYLERK